MAIFQIQHKGQGNNQLFMSLCAPTQLTKTVFAVYPVITVGTYTGFHSWYLQSQESSISLHLPWCKTREPSVEPMWYSQNICPPFSWLLPYPQMPAQMSSELQWMFLQERPLHQSDTIPHPTLHLSLCCLLWTHAHWFTKYYF